MNYSYIMNEYISDLIKLHAKIYNYDYKKIIKEYFENKPTCEISQEFLNIYGENYNDFLEILNDFLKIIEELEKKKIRDDYQIKKIFTILEEKTKNKKFLSYFLSFSILNSILYEKFSYEKKIEKNSLEIIELINYIYNDLMLFIDFLYTGNIIDLNKKNFNEKNLKKFIYRIIIVIKNKNIVTFTKTVIIKEKPKKSIRYAIMVEFKNYTKPKSLTNIFKISHEPAKIKKRNEIILIGFYLYSSNTYLISNKKFKEESKVTESFIKIMEKIANTSYYIDKEMLKIVSEKIKEKKKEDIDNIIKILKIKYAEKNKEIEENYDLDKNKELDLLKYNIKKNQKKLSSYIDIWIFEEFKKIYENCEKPIYFIPYADFRGRTYLKSLVSPQNNWIFRFIYNFGKMDNFKENNLGILILEENTNNMLKEEFKKNIITYAWILLSIGFKFKKNLNLAEGKIKIDEFIKIGLNKYKIFNKNYMILFDEMDEMDAIEAIYYITLINNIKNEIYDKRYIIKDTTASVYQHLGKILSFKNDKSLEITNLTSKNEWYDTYEPLIKIIKKDLDDDVKEFFYRKSLKPVFITTKYNVGRESALDYYLDELRYIENKDLFRKIIKNFNKVYNNLSKGEVEKKILYKMDLKEFNTNISKYQNIELEDITISLRYYLPKKEEITIFENKKRHTLVNYEKSNELDLYKIQSSSLPHAVHSLDALYARRIIDIMKEFDIEIFTIHDAFAVPFNQIDLLIIAAWDSIKIEEKLNFTNNLNKKEEINSITILI